MNKLILMFISSISMMSNYSLADLVSLDDNDLGEVDGEGIGIVLENFVFNAGEQISGGGTFEIGGLQNSSNQEVILGISQFYISGSGSNQGSNVINNPVNIGRLVNPFNLELRDGNDSSVNVPNKAVFEFAAPTKNVGSITGTTSYFVPVYENRPGATGQRVDRFSGLDTSIFSSRSNERPDMGIRFDLEIASIRYQSLESHIESLAVDGSYIRLWGSDGNMEGELAINIYTPSIEFFACDSAGNNCGNSVDFRNVGIEAQLGSGEFQPVTFEVDSTGNFVFEVESLQGKCSSINATGGCNAGVQRNALLDYYNSGPTANAYIGNVVVGNKDFGSTTISNLQIQYLEVKSHDL
jgi:hypothetical protein